VTLQPAAGSGRTLTWIAAMALVLGASLVTAATSAGSSRAVKDSGAAVRVSGATIPFSSLASPQAKRAFRSLTASLAKQPPPEPSAGNDVETVRRTQNEETDRILAEVNRRYRASIRTEILGGVPTDIVTPAAGVSVENRHRVLISLHSGGFMWGAGSEALLEAIPIAVTGRIEVISVSYRMAPEHVFPAASQDVAAVYRALLEQYGPRQIGIYGCSAGGILAAESAAWFATHRMPQPGGIASLCGTGADLTGDSAYLAPVLVGMAPVPPGGRPMLLAQMPYFKGVGAGDPLAFPIESDALLRQFPPTLLIAGSRDFAASSETLMQRRLWEAGIDSELFIFDGLWHAFMMHPELPESREVYRIVWRFFDTHLDRTPKP
jgi:monoterpene epsilon-lactone hydrolase